MISRGCSRSWSNPGETASRRHDDRSRESFPDADLPDADPSVSATDLAGAAAALQVRADVLCVRGRGASILRADPGNRARRMALAALQSLQPRWLRPGRGSAAVPMTPVFANVLQPLIDAADWLLKGLHGAGFSWGMSIILMTVIIRLAIVPLTIKQIRSMNALRALQPQVK